MSQSDLNPYLENCNSKTCIVCGTSVPEFEPEYCPCSVEGCLYREVPVNAPVCPSCEGAE
jgi:hypothetical protein